jgi:Pyruvate/2-oxoacid:ferredoxin oxidoreductase gamma subunit
LQFLGKNLPNTPLLAAAAVATKVVDLAILKEAVRDFFWKKYNQAVADKNVAMMEEVVKGKSVLSLRGVPLQAGRRSNPGSGVKQRIDGA